MVWTLWDLDHAPEHVGSLPWRTGPETTLGLLRSDGSAKPAAALYSGELDPADVPAETLWDRMLNRLRKRFWQMGLAVLAAGVITVVALRHRPGRRRPARARRTDGGRGASRAARGSPRQRPMATVHGPDGAPGHQDGAGNPALRSPHRQPGALLSRSRGRRRNGRRHRGPDRPPDAA